MRVLITEKLSEHRYKTPEGYLVCVDAILARTGPQVYKHSQVYDGSNDEITDVEVDRKPEQVFSPQAIASFENKPLTIQHPNEPVTIANHKELYHGFARDIRRAVKRNGQILTGSKRPSELQAGDQEVLVGNIIVTTSEAIEEIDNGLEFLSCGYDCDITQTDKPEQINIRGNHIALCDNPRAGITMLQDSVDFDELQKVVNRINESQSGFVLRIKPSSMKGRSQVDVIKRNDDANFYKTFSSEYALLSKLETSGCAGEILKSSNSKAVISYRMMTDTKYTPHIVKVLTDAVIEQENKLRMNDKGSIVNSRIWNPDFYLKKEPRYEEARNTIRKVLQNSGLTVEEVTLSVYGSVIAFTKNMKLDSSQMQAFVNQVLAKINPSLKAEKFRSMAGKFTFTLTGYEYLKKHLKDSVEALTDTLDTTHNFVIDEQFVYVTPEYPIDSMDWLKYFAKELRLNVNIQIKSKYYDDKVYITGRKSDVEKLVEEYNELYRNRKLVATTSTEVNSKRVYNKGYSLGDKMKDSVEDAINYVVMCEVLYNGVAVKSRAPWIAFRSEDKREVEQFVRENNAKSKSLVGFSQHYYIK